MDKLALDGVLKVESYSSIEAHHYGKFCLKDPL